MKRNPIRSRPSLRLVELEDRSVPATFTATTTQDLATTGVDLVTGKLPTGEITLRSAILAANATVGADSVVAPAGTYSLTIAGADENAGATGDLDVTDDVTLQLSGAVLDSSKLGDRVLDFLSASSTVSIVGGTIQGGTLTAPGNSDGFGGGIQNAANLTMNGVTVQNNTVIGGSSDPMGLSVGWGFGGGLFSTGPTSITGGSFLGNQAIGADNPNFGFSGGSALGGGFYFNGSAAVTIDGVQFANNLALGGKSFGVSESNSGGSASGGGIFASLNAAITISRSRVNNNQALGGNGTQNAAGGDAEAGGIYLSSPNPTVEFTTIDANRAVGGTGTGQASVSGIGGQARAGGLHFEYSGTVATLQNSTISGNSAIGGDGAGQAGGFGGLSNGGGVVISDFTSSLTAPALIASVTITDNEAVGGKGTNPGTGSGGGTYIISFFNISSPNLRSSIVAGNRADTNPDTGRDPFGGSVPFDSLGSNLIGANDDSTIGLTDGVNGDQVGNSSTPIDPMLSPLGFFGGSPLSLVHAPLVGSPARDKGADGGLTTDHRGAGFVRVVNGTADVGAFEVQLPSNVAPNISGTVVAGQPFTITGTVTDPRFAPTGSVEFFVNGSSIGTGTLDSSGNATVQTTVANAGVFTVSITYGGDAAYISAASKLASFTAVTGTTTAASAAPNPAFVMQPVTLTALVTPSAAGTPTGAAQFFVDGAPFGSPVSLDMTGTATLVAPNGFALGSHTLSANYLGDPTFGGSSSPAVNFAVVPAPTTTIVGVDPNPVFATDPIFLSATVLGQLSATPTGTVTFTIDNAPVGTVTLDSFGLAFLTVSNGLEIGDGSYDVQAVYNGDANNAGSNSVTTSLAVTPVPTLTILSAQPNAATQGQAVTLTANVDFDLPPILSGLRAGVNPTILAGSVNFFNGSTPLGSAPIDSGSATLVVTSLPVGSNAITATFVPANGNLTGSSGTASVTIAPRTSVQEVFAASSGYGIITTVKVYDANGGQLAEFQPYGPGYWCGAVVATGDVNGDRIEDVIVGTALSGGPHVKVYDGTTFNQIAEFFAYDPSFRGGVNVAAGDLDGDGVAEIITGAGPGGGPQVNIYKFDPATGLNLRNSFFAYDPGFRGGISVAVAGGLLATGPGFTGGPHVKVFNGIDATLVSSFFAFDQNSRNGVNVALSFDGNALVLTAGTDAGRQPLVQTFDAVNGQTLNTQMIYEAGFLGGVTVTNVTTANGETRQVFGTGLGGGPRVRVLGPGNVPLLDFFAFGADFRGGVFVG